MVYLSLIHISVGSDGTGSQYKHILVSNLSYTIDNTAIAQIEIGGVETAASLLITGLHLQGKMCIRDSCGFVGNDNISIDVCQHFRIMNTSDE